MFYLALPTFLILAVSKDHVTHELCNHDDGPANLSVLCRSVARILRCKI